MNVHVFSLLFHTFYYQVAMVIQLPIDVQVDQVEHARFGKSKRSSAEGQLRPRLIRVSFKVTALPRQFQGYSD
jgi:hypothetical protein